MVSAITFEVSDFQYMLGLLSRIMQYRAFDSLSHAEPPGAPSGYPI
jgi:hypothetical protein